MRAHPNSFSTQYTVKASKNGIIVEVPVKIRAGQIGIEKISGTGIASIRVRPTVGNNTKITTECNFKKIGGFPTNLLEIDRRFKNSGTSTSESYGDN